MLAFFPGWFWVLRINLQKSLFPGLLTGLYFIKTPKFGIIVFVGIITNPKIINVPKIFKES